MEDEDEDVDVGGVDEVAVSGYESEGFTLSKNLRRKRLGKKSVSEDVIDATHLQQSEFSTRHHLTLAFLFEILRWPVIEFF